MSCDVLNAQRSENSVIRTLFVCIFVNTIENPVLCGIIQTVTLAEQCNDLFFFYRCEGNHIAVEGLEQCLALGFD